MTQAHTIQRLNALKAGERFTFLRSDGTGWRNPQTPLYTALMTEVFMHVEQMASAGRIRVEQVHEHGADGKHITIRHIAVGTASALGELLT